MPIVDADGRVFGRINLVDALAILFVVGLVPAAYIAWLLFRPASPTIQSVERSAVTIAEQRIAAGLPIRLKVKVRGDHLTPLLRAQLDATPAIGFTFETPQSADVIIGENVPFGTHDLILYDGIQEVARARGAVTITPPPTAAVHAIGSLVQLDDARAKSLRNGVRFEAGGQPIAEIVALGDVQPDRAAVKDPTGRVEPPIAGWWRRDAIVAMHCEPDADESVCRIGNASIGGREEATIDVPGATPPLRMRVNGIVPEAPPRAATLRIRIDARPELAGAARAGDRDVRWPAIDSRAAVVSSAQREGAGGIELVLRAGVDRGATGWRYHGQPLEPGGTFTFVAERYAATARIDSLVVDER